MAAPNNATNAPSLNYGRSALLIQGLAWLIALPLAAWIVWGSADVLLPDNTSRNESVIVTMGTCTALVFFAWSSILACRAFLGRERLLAPSMALLGSFIMMLFCGLPIFVPYSFQLTVPLIQTGLAFFIPFVGIGGLLLAPVIWWRLRRADRRRQRAGRPAMTKREREFGAMVTYMGGDLLPKN